MSELLQSPVPEFEIIAHDPSIDSSNMALVIWSTIANNVMENYWRLDAFVTWHGTDTMVFTATAATFMLQGLRKPVICTGAQLSLGKFATLRERIRKRQWCWPLTIPLRRLVFS